MKQPLRKLISWAGAIALLALIAGCFPPERSQESSRSISTPSQTPIENSSPETPLKPLALPIPKSTYSIGQVVSINEKDLTLQFTVNGMREHEGKGVIKPNQGNKWIVVDTTTVNKGQKPKTLSVTSFELIDSENHPYQVALLAGALDDVKSPTGQIAPGDKRRGEVTFEVPEKAKGLKLLFKPNSDCEALASKPKESGKLKCTPILVKLG
jgi:hypothetical protein